MLRAHIFELQRRQSAPQYATHWLSLHRYSDRRKPNGQNNSHTPNTKPHGLTSVSWIQELKRAQVDFGSTSYWLVFRKEIFPGHQLSELKSSDSALCVFMRIPRSIRSERVSNTDEVISSEAKARAEASFRRKQEQAEEGAKAWQEYQARRLALTANMERLRALRLAKEAAEPTPEKKLGRPKRRSPRIR